MAVSFRPMRTRGVPRGVMVCLAAVLALAGACGSGGGSNAADDDGSGCKAPSTVTIAAFPAGVTLSTDMAVALDYFDEVERACNTTIKVVTYDAPATMMAGLVSGQIQYAIPTAPNIVNAAMQDRTLVNLATLSQGGSGVWITQADTTLPGSGMDALKVLDGDETWAVTSLKGVSELYVRAIYDALGVSTDHLELVALGSSGIPPALSGGKVDDAHLPAIPAAQLVTDGDAQELLNPSGPTAYELVGFVPSWVLTTSTDVADQYPELSARITAAELKGVKFLQENFTNPDAVYDKMPDEFTSTTSKSVFEAAWGWNVSAFTTTGLADKDSLVDLGQLMAKYGLIDGYKDGLITDANVAPAIQKDAYDLLGDPLPTGNVDEKLLKSAAD